MKKWTLALITYIYLCTHKCGAFHEQATRQAKYLSSNYDEQRLSVNIFTSESTLSEPDFY